MKVTLICLLLTSYVVTSPLLESPRSYCGQDLARALNLLCERPDDINIKYKQVPANPNSIEMSSNLELRQERNEEDDLVHKVENHLETQQSILKVCCMRPCNISELLSYC